MLNPRLVDSMQRSKLAVNSSASAEKSREFTPAHFLTETVRPTEAQIGQQLHVDAEHSERVKEVLVVSGRMNSEQNTEPVVQQAQSTESLG